MHYRRLAAKAAETMGDPSLMVEYRKELKKRKQLKRKRFEKLGVKSCNEVAKITGILPRTVREYAIIFGVTKFSGYGRYGWTEEEINRLIETKAIAMKEAARKQWITKRAKK